MPYRCFSCGLTQDDKEQACEAEGCGFRVGRFVHVQPTIPPGVARGGCLIMTIAGLAVAAIVYTPSLNHGAVAMLSRAIDSVIRWWFGH